ncbi:MAG TPA: hypothetical protein PK890_02390 [Terrimesophilobacter sp.]|nr:hypothetical protein [Terrimesophilobacter sp.]
MARVGVAVMGVLLVLYLVVVIQFAVGFLQAGGVVPTLLGLALIVLPLLGFWGLGAELLFGVRAGRLGAIMGREGSLPEDEFEHLPSGRPDPKAVSPHVEVFRHEATVNPDDWRAAFRHGLVLDAAGQRRLARAELVRAIKLERAERAPSPPAE